MNRPAIRWGGPAASRGATLLELVITLAIVGLLVTIAQFTWQIHSMRIRRSDATNGLLMLAAAQEAFYLEAGRYASSVRDSPPIGLGMRGTENGWYRLRVLSAGTDGYTAIATPAPGSPQERDRSCQRFVLDHRGRRDATPGELASCWR